jgi:hypothetical protein
VPVALAGAQQAAAQWQAGHGGRLRHWRRAWAGRWRYTSARSCAASRDRTSACWRCVSATRAWARGQAVLLQQGVQLSGWRAAMAACSASCSVLVRDVLARGAAGVARSGVMMCCMAGFFHCGRKKPGTCPSMDVHGPPGRGLGKEWTGRRRARPDIRGEVRARSTRIRVHGGTPF